MVGQGDERGTSDVVAASPMCFGHSWRARGSVVHPKDPQTARGVERVSYTRVGTPTRRVTPKTIVFDLQFGQLQIWRNPPIGEPTVVDPTTLTRLSVIQRGPTTLKNKEILQNRGRN